MNIHAIIEESLGASVSMRSLFLKDSRRILLRCCCIIISFSTSRFIKLSQRNGRGKHEQNKDPFYVFYNALECTKTNLTPSSSSSALLIRQSH